MNASKRRRRLDWARQAATRLGELDGDDDRIAGLAARRPSSSRANVAELAASSPRCARRRPTRFAAEVTAELAALAMPHASLTVAVTPQDEFGPHGADEVEIRLAAHPGAPALPLAKGASGGELSRVMLAIEVVFAGADPVPTFVFDEVDAGVGGKAAVEIGRRLARLARLAQVIVVTHLPQVAAFADTHLVVREGRRRQRHPQRGDPARRRRAGHRAVPDAGRPGGLRVRPGARRGAARRRRGGTRGSRRGAGAQCWLRRSWRARWQGRAGWGGAGRELNGS